MKLLIVKIVDALDQNVVGKFINSVVWCPEGFEFHDSVEEAVNEELNFMARLQHDYEPPQPDRVRLQMNRLNLFGFKDIEFIEVEVNQKEVK